MRKIFLIVLVLFFITSLSYAEQVGGYFRKDGTYVPSYERSSPNSTVRDNYSYEGQTNPYTGQEGHHHYRNNPSSEYYGTSSSRRLGAIEDD